MVASELPQQALTPTKPSGMHAETTYTSDARKGSGQVADILSRDVEYTKPPSLLAQQHIRTLVVIDGLYSFAYAGFDEIFTLWALSTVARGGLGYSSVQIGQVFFVCGLMVLLFEIFAVPNLTPRLGVGTSQRVGSVFEIPVYLLLPLLSKVNGNGAVLSFASIILLFTCFVSSNSFYIGVSLVFNKATGPDRRGELNGISATVASLARAVAPICFATLFAFSIDGDRPFPFDYRCAFYVVAALRLTVACLGWNRIN